MSGHTVQRGFRLEDRALTPISSSRRHLLPGRTALPRSHPTVRQSRRAPLFATIRGDRTLIVESVFPAFGAVPDEKPQLRGAFYLRGRLDSLPRDLRRLPRCPQQQAERGPPTRSRRTDRRVSAVSQRRLRLRSPRMAPPRPRSRRHSGHLQRLRTRSKPQPSSPLPTTSLPDNDEQGQTPPYSNPGESLSQSRLCWRTRGPQPAAGQELAFAPGDRDYLSTANLVRHASDKFGVGHSSSRRHGRHHRRPCPLDHR